MKKYSLFAALALVASLTLTACSLTGALESLGDAVNELGESISEELDTGSESGTEISVELASNQVKEEHRNAQGKLDYYMIKTYDEEKKLIRQATYDANGHELCAYDHTYTEDGRPLLGSWFFSRDGLLMPVEYFYDEDGNLIKEWHHGSEQYNTVGNMTYYSDYDANGNALYKEYYSVWREDDSHDDPCCIFLEFNENNKLVRETGYNNKNKETKIYTRVSEWNDFGKMAKLTRYNETDQMEYYTVYLYEGETCIGTDTYNPDGSLQNSTRYER